MPEHRRLEAGDPAPWFTQRSTTSPAYHFDTAAGRYIVLCFYGSASDTCRQQMLHLVEEERALFDDDKICFFGVGVDPADEAAGRVKEQVPGIRFFLDHDAMVSRLYGAAPADTTSGGTVQIRRFWAVVDPTMRVRAIFPGKPDGSDRHQVAGFLKALPPVDSFAGFTIQAPIIVLPDVFERDFCEHLVGLYRTHGGEESGFMREIGGKTVAVVDPRHKRRTDHTIEDEGLKKLIQQKIVRRIVPEIEKVHQFKATRMERYIVACYDSENGGHFRAHRDNTTKGTAHRRFAVSINLNSEFDGGEVSFPEYGARSFKPPVGGAVIFSCSLLHAVSPVMRGKRYAFLPFLYDDAAAALREANNKYLDAAVVAYSRDG